MALERTQGQIYRWGVASPLAFEDWRTPTVAELNANPTNDPEGLIFDLTCALDTDGTTFDLTDPDTDDSTSFCQEATEETPISRNVEIVLELFRATEENKIDDPNTWNTAHLGDRKSTRLNSSHVATSYAVFCLKKKMLNANNYTAEGYLELEERRHKSNVYVDLPDAVLGAARDELPILFLRLHRAAQYCTLVLG